MKPILTLKTRNPISQNPTPLSQLSPGQGFRFRPGDWMYIKTAAVPSSGLITALKICNGELQSYNETTPVFPGEIKVVP